MIRFDTAGTRPWQRWFYAHLQVGPSPVQARAGCLLLSAIAQVLADEGQLKEVQGVPTYYFHIKHAGYVIADPDGGNFVDLDSTKIEASGALREIVARAILSIRPEIPQAIEIWDVRGHPVAGVDIDAAIPQIAHRGKNQ